MYTDIHSYMHTYESPLTTNMVPAIFTVFKIDMHVCMCIYTYTYMHTFIHTYVHINEHGTCNFHGIQDRHAYEHNTPI